MTDQHMINAMLRSDPYSFMKHFFPVMFPGEVFEDGPHLRAIAWQMQRILEGKEMRLVVNQPPRSLKSYAFSVILPALYLGHHPERRIVCVSYSEDLAAKLSRDCKKIMQSDRYKQLFPGAAIGKKNAEMEYETVKGGGRLALTMGGAITGRGADMIVIDDPVKPEDMKSIPERQRVKDVIDGTLYSRLNNKNTGILVMVMQRLHADDPTAHLLDKGNFKHLSFPAIATEDMQVQISDRRHVLRAADSVLLPGREGLETLRRLQADMSSFYFAAQYQQAPVFETGAIFQKEWFGLPASDVFPARTMLERCVVSWDIANMPGQGHDYTVGTVWGIYEARYYLLEVIRQRVAYPELKKLIISVHGTYPNCTTLIEQAGNGIALLQDLKNTKVTAVPYKPKLSKEERAHQAAGTLEARKVILPVNTPWLAEFINEVVAFPNGRYDDQVDSMTQFLCWQAGKGHLKRYERIFRPPEQLGDWKPIDWGDC